LDITLEDGTILTKTVIFPVGDPQNPFSREKCDEKFRAVTAGILPLEQAERICASVWKIEELEDISELLK
jgi:2-methylcitrate dehydratase PrpD